MDAQPTSPRQYDNDPRVVLTLDAGGTNLKFTAIRGNALLMDPIYVPSQPRDLQKCLDSIVEGFRHVSTLVPETPAAISFAFPGPADYPAGIIGDLPNLPAFRGGVPLGPLLEDEFKIPVFINNDGNLFAYGESIAGLLPKVNALLAEAGSPKRYRNLFALTIGTGLGGGVMHDGRLIIGDNSNGGEAWLLRNPLTSASCAEEGGCIRAVKRVYAELTGLPKTEVPEPQAIAEIAHGRAAGDTEAAKEAFRRLGTVVGDALAQALTLLDGLAVLGGGLAAAHPLFMPTLLEAVNRPYTEGEGTTVSRLMAKMYNLEDATQCQQFLTGHLRTLKVPGSGREITSDFDIRTAVGVSLKTSESVAIGAYAFALQKLDSGDQTS